jgi:hypothetical protein
LAGNDPVYAWREKLLDAFDGMARNSPGYDVQCAHRFATGFEINK